MLMISGRFGLVLLLASLFLSAGRSTSPLSRLPEQVVQIVDLSAIYGFAMIAAAIVIRSFTWLCRTLTEIGDGD
ncbi:hypothetical protein [Bosea sp. LjRoot237]|uniref:hypothetical protein n=1 Tax=Bosea sp. LjRoot237 TaxID=3342292 RepID=UPI003ECE6ED9